MADDLVSLSYRELAKHFGIGIDGARMKAHRAVKKGRWRIRPGNHPQDAVTVILPREDLANVRGRYPRAQTPDVRGANAHSEQLITALQSSVALIEQLMADNRDAQAEIRRLSKELLSAQVRIMEGKDAHRRDEIDLAATSTREMGTRAELDRALNHIQVLKRRLVTANRPLWRKAFGIK
jgi:hypothetical protein